jgi:hypothetical protein
MNFVLIDESNGAKTADGSSLSPAVLEQIAVAATVYLNRDVAAYWGIPVGATVRVGAADSILPGEWAFALLDVLPNAPGAIAYHDTDGNGVPVLFDGVSLSDSLIGSGNSVSVAITHELAETVGDESCNFWADDGKGQEHALELCDAVENGDYLVTGVACSNFVLPAFFNPSAAGPYDFLKKLTSPFQTQGYQIVRTSGTGETQVTGKAHRLDKRRHALSRTFRRGARL